MAPVAAMAARSGSYARTASADESATNVKKEVWPLCYHRTGPLRLQSSRAAAPRRWGRPGSRGPRDRRRSGVQGAAAGVEGERRRAVDRRPTGATRGRRPGWRGRTGRSRWPARTSAGRRWWARRRGTRKAVSAMPSSKAIDCMRASSSGSSSRQTPAGLPPKGTSLKASTQASGMVMVPTMLSGRARRAGRRPACRRPSARACAPPSGSPGS